MNKEKIVLETKRQIITFFCPLFKYVKAAEKIQSTISLTLTKIATL